MVWAILIAVIVSAIGTIYLYSRFKERRNVLSLANKHVLITGGSKGIGKALAEEVLRMGANVTLLARNQEDLDTTKMYLLKKAVNPKKQKIMALSVDISKDIFPIEQAVSDAESELGPVFMLINCAGTSMSARFDETPLHEFKRMMDINYMGTVLTTRAVLPSMKEQRAGCILFVSSVAGLLGLYGYSAYSSSKFAIVGLAEVLSMELKPFDISVSVSFPPDTDTPGFEEENKSKPVETRLISESGGLYSAQTVAQVALRDALSKKFASTVGLESLMVRTVCCGMMPISNAWELTFQVLTMGIFRIVSAIFLNTCSGIVAKCAKEKKQDQPPSRTPSIEKEPSESGSSTGDELERSKEH